MTIDCQITVDDVLQFNRHHLSASPTARRTFLRAWLLLPIVLFAAAVVMYFAAFSDQFPFVVAIVWFAFFGTLSLAHIVLFPWRYRSSIEKQVRGMLMEGHNRGLLGPRRITITPESISEVSDCGQTVRVWSCIERIVVTQAALYVYLHCLSALIIPERCFGTRAEFEDFADLTEHYFESARPAVREEC